MKKYPLIAIVVFAVFFTSGVAFGRNVTLEWDRVNHSTVTGYRIYWGTQSRTYNDHYDAGNVTTTTISVPLETTNYYFAASTLTEDGSEYKYSMEVMIYGKASYYEHDVIDNHDGSFTLAITNIVSINIEGSPGIMAKTTVNYYPQTFNEPIIVKRGQQYIGSDEAMVRPKFECFFVVGKVTGTVWRISQNTGGTAHDLSYGSTIMLSNPGMTQVDDVLIGDFNKSQDMLGLGDDIALIDYLHGKMQVHLYNGTDFDWFPMPDDHITKGDLCSFSGNNAFLRGTTGDFDGDGNCDILLMAPVTGNNVVWLSNGTAIYDRYAWCIGGSVDAYPMAIDYDGDGACDLLLVNFSGGAFSAWKSDGTHFSRECVQTFSANAFTNVLRGDFIANGDDKWEFALHSQTVSTYLVVFEYAPAYSGDPAPFKSRKAWAAISGKLL